MQGRGLAGWDGHDPNVAMHSTLGRLLVVVRAVVEGEEIYCAYLIHRDLLS